MSFESIPDVGGQNHFNLFRLLAASAVIVSHAYSLTLGAEAPDPLQTLVGVDLGTTAVFAFFAISGYFISLSFERRGSNGDFILARVTRIFPGLIVVTLFAAFLVGPLLSALPMPAYFASSVVWLYPLRTVALVGPLLSPELPGLFIHNPVHHVNGSLWTLLFEVACYIGLFSAGILGFLRRERFPWLLAAWLPVCLIVIYSGAFPNIHFFAIFSVPFVIGMIVYQYRPSGILNPWVGLLWFALAFALGLSGHFNEEIWSSAVAYEVLCLGFAPAPALLGYNSGGDFSYGTYIYGYLVGQVLVDLLPGMTPVELMALSLPAAIMCGVLSWFYVERPALNLRKTILASRMKASAPS